MEKTVVRLRSGHHIYLNTYNAMTRRIKNKVKETFGNVSIIDNLDGVIQVDLSGVNNASIGLRNIQSDVRYFTFSLKDGKANIYIY